MIAKQFQLPLSTRWLILAVLFCNTALLIFELSVWISAIIVLLIGYQTLIISNKVKSPHRMIIWLIAIVGTIILALQGKQLGILISMLNLLCFSYILKLFELKRRQDFFLHSVLGLFVLASAMIFQQSLQLSLVFFVILTLNLLPLLNYFSPVLAKTPLTTKSLQLLLQSLPLALLMFFVFPRLTPFWQVPLANSAKTGLSEQVTIGDISRLVQSNELAFRVTFTDNAPNFEQRYWRTLVMENFNGKTWTIDNKLKQQSNFQTLPTPKIDYQGNSINYNIIAEPSFQPWLFALDVAQVPTNEQNNIKLTTDYTLKYKQPLSQKLSYQITSYPNTFLSVPELSAQSRIKNLMLPQNSNPKLKQLAQQLVLEYPDKQTLIARILETIRQQSYFYTLTPPLLSAGNNNLDQFFFDTKAGFCVHYASSFTFLMRAAGIPARLVTGYMGAEYNQNADFYSVYQRDAHAWSEVWLEGKGWTRVDPTAAVSPDRVNQGFNQVANLQQDLFSQSFFGSYQNIQWLNNIKQRLDALDYYWVRWIIGYSNEKQFNLLKKLLGEHSITKLSLLIAAILITSMAFLWLINKEKAVKNTRNNWQQYYDDIQTRLAKHQLYKQPNQPLTEFGKQAIQQHPNLAPYLEKFYFYFQQLEYKNLSEQQNRKVLSIYYKIYKKLKQQL